MTLFLALVAVGATGARYDAEAHRLEARAAAAADLRAPSAAIARVKAERTARARAEKKLTDALDELGWKPCAHLPPNADCADLAATRELLEKAELVDEVYGSDGSVELTLRLPTAGLHLKERATR